MIRSLIKSKLFQIYALISIFYWLLFWARSFRMSPNGDLMAGHLNIWGDWAVHFTMGSAMAFRSLFLTESPLLIGAPFNYPFGANLLSALLIRSGMPFLLSFVLPSAFFSIAATLLIYVFYRVLFRSDRAAFFGSFIFFLCGGLYFWDYFQLAANSLIPLITIIFPPRDYPGVPIVPFRTILDTMMIPQRAFTMGFPIAILGLINLFRFLEKDYSGPWPPRPMLVSVLLIGILPIIHMHSFVAAIFIAGAWLCADLFLGSPERDPRRWKIWLWSIALLTVIATPLLYALLGAKGGTQRPEWHLGWYAKEWGHNWFLFWIKTWGPTPLLALAGWIIYARKKILPLEKRQALVLFAPFFLMFALVNTIRLHPWIWDNTKLLVWASVGISGLAGYATDLIFNKRKIPAMALMVTMCLFGFIDAVRIQQTHRNQTRFYTREEIELARWVKEKTPPHSVWLTANNHNHWLFNLTGRQALMTYPGWLWSHGYDYRWMEKDVNDLYHFPKNASLFEEHGVNYIVIGPYEIKQFSPNVEEFEMIFTLVKQTASYKIFSRP